LPQKTERVQQWLSSCPARVDECRQHHQQTTMEHESRPTQLKMRCIAKPLRSTSTSPLYHPSKSTSTSSDRIDIEPGRFRSCLKIELDTNDYEHERIRSSPMKHRHMQTPVQKQTDDRLQGFFEHHLDDQQAVYL
jgi:hypothetical protein